MATILVMGGAKWDNLIVACSLTHGAVANVMDCGWRFTKPKVSANYAAHGGHPAHVLALRLGCATHLSVAQVVASSGLVHHLHKIRHHKSTMKRLLQPLFCQCNFQWNRSGFPFLTTQPTIQKKLALPS
jgi:hypothetical protein